ncbi:MAG: hypothetical protein ABW252_20240 [Polyangiales bacterium]
MFALLASRVRAIYAAALLGCLLGIVAEARAQLPEGVDIQWKTSSECTRPLDLEWQVTRLLAPSLQVDAPVSFAVRVESRAAGRHALWLRSEGDRALEREVELGSCGEVQDAVALLIAIALDPSAEQRARALQEEPPRAPAPPPKQPEPPKPPPEEEPRRVVKRKRLLPRPHAVLHASLLGDLHALPDASLGPAAGVALALGPLRIGLSGMYLLPRRAQTALPGVSARVDLGAGALELAYLPSLGRAVLGPFAGFEAGHLRAVGVGAEDGRVTGTLWLAALFGGRLEVDVHPRIAVRLGVLAGLPLRRPRLALRDDSVFYATRSVTARVELGVSIRLGSPP